MAVKSRNSGTEIQTVRWQGLAGVEWILNLIDISWMLVLSEAAALAGCLLLLHLYPFLTVALPTLLLVPLLDCTVHVWCVHVWYVRVHVQCVRVHVVWCGDHQMRSWLTWLALAESSRRCTRSWRWSPWNQHYTSVLVCWWECVGSCGGVGVCVYRWCRVTTGDTTTYTYCEMATVCAYRAAGLYMHTQ